MGFYNMDELKKLRNKLIETELIAKNAKDKIFKHRDRLRFYSRALLKAIHNMDKIKLKIEGLLHLSQNELY